MTNSDLINRQEAIDVLSLGKEIFNRVLDNIDVVGIDREKYSFGLKLIESDIEDIKELPPAQQEYEEITPEEVASEIASGSIMSARYWLNIIIQLKQMGYVICRKR